MNVVADEGVDSQIVLRLRLEGHSVISVAETHSSITDEAVLDLANETSATLLTTDKDFGELVFREQRLIQGGVILIRLAGISSEMKATLVADAFRERISEFPHSFTVLSPGKLRIVGQI